VRQAGRGAGWGGGGGVAPISARGRASVQWSAEIKTSVNIYNAVPEMSMAGEYAQARYGAAAMSVP